MAEPEERRTPWITSNSAGTSELGEVGWTDAARAQAIASRRMKMRTPEPKKAKASGSGGGKSSGGGGKAPARAKKTGERTNDVGERVIDFGDGSNVTVHKDGTATHTTKDGVQQRGAYKDPEAKKPNTDPEGFTKPKVKALKNTQKRAVEKPKKPARAAKLVKARLSRTVAGPAAGTLPYAR